MKNRAFTLTLIFISFALIVLIMPSAVVIDTSGGSFPIPERYRRRAGCHVGQLARDVHGEAGDRPARPS